ncbi:MAG: type II secretion system GspH family protein [Gemmatimonadaceae bacterium]|nr:type II secretion system GspH family protein [Gemmatimonadaceae bacterium]
MRRGFTLIELMIVTVIISILALFLIRRWWETKEKAWFASMKADLRSFVSAQAAFQADSGRFAANVNEISFRTSPGVTISIDAIRQEGFDASAIHASMTGARCTISIDGATPDGVPDCIR